jgi:positive regulator of sigma E activity
LQAENAVDLGVNEFHSMRGALLMYFLTFILLEK